VLPPVCPCRHPYAWANVTTVVGPTAVGVLLACWATGKQTTICHAQFRDATWAFRVRRSCPLATDETPFYWLLDLVSWDTRQSLLDLLQTLKFSCHRPPLCFLI